MLLLVILTTLSLGCWGEEVQYEDIGCFRDKIKNRTLPVLLHNYRDSIDWHNEWPNLDRVIRNCSALAKEKGYLYFGVQFYGECWSGPDGHRTFYKYGKSKRCTHGVGKACANRVYMLLGTGREQCAKENYHLLDEHDRSVTYNIGYGSKCDNPLPHGPGWYRFKGAAGNIMAMAPSKKYSCSTASPSWMTGELPDINTGLVKNKVCFAVNEVWEKPNDCKYSETIVVKNCGHFYVFKLPVTPRCLLRYCGSRINSLPVDF